MMDFRFLGTGTSVGVPQIGCRCKVCTSDDPRDRRRRCGAYIRCGKTGVLIDTPLEMREACCEYRIDHVDAVVLTHAHMDHVAGFDDVRRFNTLNGTKVACDPNSPGANGRTFRIIGKPMICYCSAETEAHMHRIFPYIGTEGGKNGLFRPQISYENRDRFSIGSLRFRRLEVEHGFPCCGYLIREEGIVNSEQAVAGNSEQVRNERSLAYISDCHVIPEKTIRVIRGVDTLVLNCLREREHPTHLSLERAREYIDRIGPRRAFLIHMCHDFSHREWLRKLRGTSVKPAYDGLKLRIG